MARVTPSASLLASGGSVYNPNASYTYDGDGNRVQQVDYSGSQAITVTYTNDNTGLSQVLIADNGTTQTANLYGRDLILQDDGNQTRALLPNGLGSVRQEMANDAIQTATTYEPYGNILAQTGTSNTTYAFTGEQFDGATNLLYLRARYYNPGLKFFMSRDPFPGSLAMPASQHGYIYVHNNPVNTVDPEGLCIGNCPPKQPQPGNTPTPPYPLPTQGTPMPPGYTQPLPSANICPEPAPTPPGNRAPNPKPSSPTHPGFGYAEGGYLTISAVSGLFGGREVVYDFATFERKRFQFSGYSVGFQLNFIGAEGYVAQLFGFNPDRDIIRDYSGYFEGVSAGIGSPIPVLDVGAGTMIFSSVARDQVLPNGDVWGIAFIAAYSLWSPPPVTGAWFVSYYTPMGNPAHADQTYVVNGKVDRLALAADILSGRDSDLPNSPELIPSRLFALSQAMVAANWYDSGLYRGK